MPHCQKEKHDHAAKSKKEKLRIKQEKIARKQALTLAREKAELEASKPKPNIIAPVEGQREYEIGCEPEAEHRFNKLKRRNKHLRTDLIRNFERAEREEEERKKREEEERLRQEQEKENGQESSSSEEEEVEEYIIYICECCNKKFATKNQFINHSNSKKHKDNAAIYEEAGVIVTGVELRGQTDEVYNDEDKEESDDEEEMYGMAIDREDWYSGEDWYGEENHFEEESEEEEELHKPSVFSAFAALDDSSTSSSSASSDDEEEEEDRKLPPRPSAKTADENDSEETDDDIDFDELIYQNQLLQSKIDAENEKAIPPTAAVPLPFHDTYDPDDYSVNDNRLAAVHHRLQKRLAAKGVEPTQRRSNADSIAIGKTLLQQLMEANKNDLEAKLEAYNRHKQECQLINRGFAFAKGNSKALAAQYVRKQDAADNARRRANVHHTGSHYHMAASRSQMHGKIKGLMARHSSQGARLQANRMAAKEIARTQTGGGMKVGKTSKKSQQKRRGEAGGSKKNGGTKE